MTVADKRKTFRPARERLLCHSQSVECRHRALFAGLGFKTLATTSSGLPTQWARRRRVSRDEVLGHYREIAAPPISFNADFENGFADDPDGVAANVTRCIETGVAGLSIEDFSGGAGEPIYDFDFAVQRVRARAAIDKAGGDVVLTGRSEASPAPARPRRRPFPA